MLKYVAVVAMLACGVIAAPEPKPLVVASPFAIAPGVVTAQSSQVIARNYNTLAAPLVAPAAVAYTQPIVKAAPLVAGPAAVTYTHPIVKTAPLVSTPIVKSAPLVAAPAFTSPYVAAAYSSPYVAPAYYL